MAHVVSPFGRESLPTPLFLRHRHVFVPAVDEHDQSLVRAVETRPPTGRAQRVGRIVHGIEDVVFAVAVRVDFGFALFRRGFGLCFGAGGTRTRFGMD